VETEACNEQRTTVAEIREIVLPVLRRHGITRAGIFGSFARGTPAPESDVDILVELDKQLSLLDFIGIKLDLEDVLGRPVDLVEYAAIKPRLRDRILREQVPVL
jgi:predicted nucleotidyltransferase